MRIAFLPSGLTLVWISVLVTATDRAGLANAPARTPLAPFSHGIRTVSGPGGRVWLYWLQKPSSPQLRANSAHLSTPPASADFLLVSIAISYTGWDSAATEWAVSSPIRPVTTARWPLMSASTAALAALAARTAASTIFLGTRGSLRRRA